MQSRIMYIENKSQGLSNGESHIGKVTYSKTGQTLYYKEKTFRSLKGAGYKANYFEVESKDEYWISGPKKDGTDRLYGERVPIMVDNDIAEVYWTEIRGRPIPKNK